MRQNLDATVALLSRTPAALDALLRGLPEEWTERDEGQGTWTVRGIMGHLLHGERTDWMPRARMILEFGEGRTFERFDRTAQDRGGSATSIETLLEEFAAARAGNLEELRGMGLSEADLRKTGVHPVFGRVTLSELLATWAAHDMTHLHQISRVMAVQYREAAGPWVAFLGVMRCGGHSD